MDPNAAAAELSDLRTELSAVFQRTPASKRVRDLQRDIAEHVSDLREWRRKGGFTPRGGWPKGV